MRSILRCAGKIQRRPRPSKVESLAPQNSGRKNEIESLTAHCMRGIKISLNDEKLAEDIAGAWKKGKLKKDRDFLLFQAEFDSYATPI